MENLPEEVVYRILSFLSFDELARLTLSNKQYWNICRYKLNGCEWDSQVCWLNQFLETRQMMFKETLQIESIGNLQSKYNILKAPSSESYMVTWKPFRDGYVWYLPNKQVDLLKIMCSIHPGPSEHHDKIFKIYCEYIHPTLVTRGRLCRDCKESEIMSVYDKFMEIEDSPMIFYLNEIFDLEREDIRLIDRVLVDDFVIWKVLKLDENNKTRHVIGRAVLSPHKCCSDTESRVLVVFGETEPFGFGNLTMDSDDVPLDDEDLHYIHVWGMP